MDPNETTHVADVSAPDAVIAEPIRRLRYQEAFEFAPDCQLVTDRHGILVEANHAATVLLGSRKEFLINKPLGLFAVEGSRARFYECLWRLGQGALMDAFETRLSRRGDNPHEAHVVARVGERFGDPTAPGTIYWLIRDITQWRRAEDARAFLQLRLTTAQEDERRRIARDMHDTVGQTLTALALGIQALRDAGPLPQATLCRLDVVQRLADELAGQVHDLATRLRPTALDDLGLEAAAGHLVADWSVHTGVNADFQSDGLTAERLPSEVETTLYRVVQEALTNIAKHARARRVAVVLGRNDGYAVAVIEDDGIGFDPEEIAPTPRRADTRDRLGLLGMRERVTLVGGTLEIEAALGRGTTIIARVPLQAAPGENNRHPVS